VYQASEIPTLATQVLEMINKPVAAVQRERPKTKKSDDFFYLKGPRDVVRGTIDL